MSGAIPPFPQYTFMAWCSVKKKYRDNFTFTFTFGRMMKWREVGGDCIMRSFIRSDHGG